ncbi:MAG: DUF5615 family PIN-like protein [Pleurocapsa sp. SU_196_0]|nr:DUF5615 family PIN-like protein [Pleurocapsa sp. SU_196_0]
MRFLIDDAHFPKRLARLLEERGHQAIHTSEFPRQNKTADRELMENADVNDFAVMTKDADFVDSFYLKNSPKKLWLISTGNITNRELEEIIDRNLEIIVQGLTLHTFVELNRTQMIIHT